MPFCKVFLPDNRRHDVVRARKNVARVLDSIGTNLVDKLADRYDDFNDDVPSYLIRTVAMIDMLADSFVNR